MTLHTVYLTTPKLERMALQVSQQSPGVYELTEVQGFASLADKSLAFDVENLDPEVQNHDKRSDSASCFGMSEHLQGPELLVKGHTFHALNLSQLQSGLDRLRGTLLSSAEF